MTCQKPVKITEMKKGATITLGELDAALTRLGYSADLLVGSIYKNVVDHREPEWESGDVVKDAVGVLYRRTSSGGWQTFGNQATYDHGHPARPLKIMNVVEHREPEWKAGDVVKDAAGTLYRRASFGGWHTFGSAATYLHDYPARPLKRISREPGWEDT